MERKCDVYIQPEEAASYMQTHRGLLKRKKIVAAICIDNNNISYIWLTHWKNKEYMVEVMDNFRIITRYMGIPQMIASKMPEYIDLIAKLHGEEVKKYA